MEILNNEPEQEQEETEILTLTDENGVASVPFYTAGTYTISAYSDSQTLVPPVCLAVIGENAPQTADYGVWCLGGAVVMLGAAYVTARKERSYEN